MWHPTIIIILISIALVSILLITIAILEDAANRRHINRDRSKPEE